MVVVLLQVLQGFVVFLEVEEAVVEVAAIQQIRLVALEDYLQ
jgi:hypothetical protein